MGPADSHLQRFVGLAVAGDWRAALQAASEACHAAPRRPHPHYAYGQAWTALGDHARAARAFAESVRLAPNWADAWINLGLARYREGAMPDARIAMRQALLRDPGHLAAIANMAAFMRISGEAEAAIRMLQDAVARNPADAGSRLNLVGDHLQSGNWSEALALLDAAPELPAEPDVRCHWLLQHASALLAAGQPQQATGVLDGIAAAGPVPPHLAPLFHWRRLMVAEAAGDAAAASALAAGMTEALETMGPAAVPEHRIMAHYDLARFWHVRKDLHAAFAHWQKGHALLRPMQPFSREAHRGYIDACIARLGRERLHDGARARNADAAPVFIVGMPRSGTTLCEQIIDSHPDGHGAGERAALPIAVRDLTGQCPTGALMAERLAALPQATLDAAAASAPAAISSSRPARR